MGRSGLAQAVLGLLSAANFGGGVVGRLGDDFGGLHYHYHYLGNAAAFVYMRYNRHVCRLRGGRFSLDEGAYCSIPFRFVQAGDVGEKWGLCSWLDLFRGRIHVHSH